MNIVGEYRRNPAQWDAQGRMICRFYQRGVCRFGARCRNSHEEAVSPATNSPKHQNQVRNNVRPWNDRIESTTLDSSGNAPSTTQMSCGICLEVVMEKPNYTSRTFGILPNCIHCFCFVCIQQWRRNTEVAQNASKSCPECRTYSNYVYASKRWFDIKEEKESFIAKEKDRMQNIDCRYFKQGDGYCRFRNKCMYRHALSNGDRVDLGSPNHSRHSGPNFFDDYPTDYDSDDDDFAFDTDDDHARYYDSSTDSS